jgi:hypothetical protein
MLFLYDHHKSMLGDAQTSPTGNHAQPRASCNRQLRGQQANAASKIILATKTSDGAGTDENLRTALIWQLRPKFIKPQDTNLCVCLACARDNATMFSRLVVERKSHRISSLQKTNGGLCHLVKRIGKIGNCHVTMLTIFSNRSSSPACSVKLVGKCHGAKSA